MSDSEMIGYPPVLTIQPVRPSEREIYREIWQHEEYREYAPGEACVTKFLELARPKPGSSILDLGCGTGRASLLLAAVGQMDVTAVDFVPASVCLDPDIRPMLETQSHTLKFVEADLSVHIPATAVYGFCTDTMEHLPPEQVDATLDNILHACQHVYFQIATHDDVMGKLVGYPLHLSVHDYAWWLAKFNERDCVIHWSKDSGSHCSFYVSAWRDGREIVEIGVLNVEQEQVLENVRHNIGQGWSQVEPHETNDIEVMIVGGGPSLAQFEEEIKQKRAEGVKLITLNGAYNWALEHGIIPSATIIVDAREFNKRFLRPLNDTCKYLIASQCHPSLFEGLPKDRTLIWHTSAEFIQDALNEQYDGKWWGIVGGSTVLLRSIPLCRLLGFCKFHLYGCDSCLTEGEHHAYLQSENDEELVIPVTVAGRIFHCYPWMLSQAQETIDLIRVFADEIELEIHGDGLLKHILDAGAEQWDEAESQILSGKMVLD